MLAGDGTPVVMKGRLGRPSQWAVNARAVTAPPVDDVILPSEETSPLPVPLATVLPPSMMSPEDASASRVEEMKTTRRKRHGTNDIMKEVKRAPGGDAVFDVLMKALAEEAELVEFERDRVLGGLAGRSFEQLTEIRVRTIKMMTEAWLKRRARSGGGIDFDGPAFAAIFGFVLETFRGALEDSGMRAEHIETVFAKLSKRMTTEWKEEARLRIREKASS